MEKSHDEKIKFFYDNIDKMSIGGLTTEEAETIIITRKDSDRATITTSDSVMFTKLRRNIINDPTHKEWKIEDYTIGYHEKNPYHVVELVVSCPRKLVSLRSKTLTREITDEQREALRDRVLKMHESRKNK